jgi:hypothetical protein
MDLYDFTQAMSRLAEDDIRRLAAGIEARFISPADEVAWWKANLAIDRVLKDSDRWRIAALAAVAASKAVVGAAEADGVTVPDAQVTCVARAAGQIARGLAAGHGATPAVDYLLETWRPLFTGTPFVPHLAIVAGTAAR